MKKAVDKRSFKVKENCRKKFICYVLQIKNKLQLMQPNFKIIITRFSHCPKTTKKPKIHKVFLVIDPTIILKMLQYKLKDL